MISIFSKIATLTIALVMFGCGNPSSSRFSVSGLDTLYAPKYSNDSYCTSMARVQFSPFVKQTALINISSCRETDRLHQMDLKAERYPFRYNA